MIDSSWEGAETEHQVFQITHDMIRRWTDCMEDDHPLYADRNTARTYGYADVLIPPTLPIAFWNNFSIPWMKQVKTVIHQKQAFTYYASVTAGMSIQTWITLKEVEQIKLPSGVFQRVRQTLTGVEADKLLFEAVMTMLIPLQREELPPKKPKGRKKVQAESEVTASFSLDWLKQYTECSGDRQAIHLDDKAAQQAGFSRQIVHGMLLMGVAARLFHKKIDQGYRMTFFEVRFLSPVLRDEQVYFFSKKQKPDTSTMNIHGLNQDGILLFMGIIQ